MPLNAINISIEDETLSSNFISDILFEMGALSVSVTDLHAGNPKAEQPIYAQPASEKSKEVRTIQAWRNARIVALYPITADVQQLIMLIGTEFDLRSTPTCRIEVESFEDERTPDEWVRHVQSSFQPIELDRIRISFPWHSPSHPDLINIKLEPGMAFGTGEHPTTQMCLLWLQRVIKPHDHILDFGSGSGVLAIAACLLQKETEAVGVDIDPMANKVAKQNALKNNVGKQVQFYENENEPQQNQYDIVIANILARPLRELAPLLVSRLKKGGFVAMSGLLTTQAPPLVEHYSNYGVTLHDAKVNSGWVLIVGRKK